MTNEEAIKTLDEVIPPPNHHTVDYEHLSIAIAWATIKQTLADVQEMRKHGEWSEKQRGYDLDERFVCSICGEDTEDRSPYCPWCGAKMEWGD